MKKIYLMVLLVLVSFSSCKGETNLLSLIPKESFELKTGMASPPPSMKPLFFYRKQKISELQNARHGIYSVFLENYFIEHRSISRKELMKFLNSPEKYIILRNYYDDGGGSVEASYNKVFIKNQSIGEVVFHGSYNHSEVVGRFLYYLSYLDEGEIIRFAIAFDVAGQEMEILSTLPEIFSKKNDAWYWKNGNQSVIDLYNLMVSRDSRLPKVFIELQDTWEHIISNLKIDGVKVEVK